VDTRKGLDERLARIDSMPRNLMRRSQASELDGARPLADSDATGPSYPYSHRATVATENIQTPCRNHLPESQMSLQQASLVVERDLS